jgi:putative transposase
VIHHSDRGCQYISGDYHQALKHAGLLPSMSATGSCYDNAAMESFWSILKREIGVICFQSQPEARLTSPHVLEILMNPLSTNSHLDRP